MADVKAIFSASAIAIAEVFRSNRGVNPDLIRPNQTVFIWALAIRKSQDRATELAPLPLLNPCTFPGVWLTYGRSLGNLWLTDC